jgi:hypothetical protein
MKISLWHRRYGVHSRVKEATIDGSFGDYCTLADEVYDQYDIDEGKLIESLPEGFLPVTPSQCLLCVEMAGSGGTSTGQSDLRIFRPWGKYFNSFSLQLDEEDKK